MSARERLFGFVQAGAEEADLPTFAAAVDAHRDEVRTEDARLLEDAACDADWTRTPDYCAGLRAGAELLLADTEGTTTATDTPGNRAAEILTKAADYFEERRPAVADLVSDFDRGRRATVGWVVEELREKATAAAAATATPEAGEIRG